MPPPPPILEDNLTLSQLGGAHSAHQITTRPHRFLDLPPSLLEQRGHRGHDVLAVTDKSERHENYFPRKIIFTGY